MEQEEVIALLKENGIIKLTTETRYGTFTTTNKSSLIAQQVSNRSSADWKKAQFIIINKSDTNNQISHDEFIEGWKSLAEDIQFLIVFEDGEWNCYDYLGTNVSLDKILSSKVSNCTNKYVKLLLAKKNLVLTGAPGTGKTYLAKSIAASLIGNCDWNSLSDQQKKQVGFVQFHPSYDYTDFVEGLRPNRSGAFERMDGIFKTFCKRALIKTFCKRALNITDDVPIIATNLFNKVYNELLDDIRKGVITSYDRITSAPRGVSVNDKNRIVYGPEDKYPRTLSLKNLKLLFDLYVSQGRRSADGLKRDDLNSAIGKLTNGRTSTLDYVEYIWTLNQLLPRVTEEDKDVYSEDSSENSSEKEDVPYVFIIDEINRGELSKILGELFYSIDPPYRGPEGTVTTQYNTLVDDDDVFKDGFFVPSNVYVIGTMNDVDRGVEAMDFAIRRRFGWVEITAEESADNMGITGLTRAKMRAVNDAMVANCGLTGAYQIGGAYFRNSNGDYDSLWTYNLDGLLREYFRGDPDIEDKMVLLKNAYDAVNCITSGNEETSVSEDQDGKTQDTEE